MTEGRPSSSAVRIRSRMAWPLGSLEGAPSPRASELNTLFSAEVDHCPRKVEIRNAESALGGDGRSSGGRIQAPPYALTLPLHNQHAVRFFFRCKSIFNMVALSVENYHRRNDPTSRQCPGGGSCPVPQRLPPQTSSGRIFFSPQPCRVLYLPERFGWLRLLRVALTRGKLLSASAPSGLQDLKALDTVCHVQEAEMAKTCHAS